MIYLKVGAFAWDSMHFVSYAIANNVKGELRGLLEFTKLRCVTLETYIN